MSSHLRSSLCGTRGVLQDVSGDVQCFMPTQCCYPLWAALIQPDATYCNPLELCVGSVCATEACGVVLAAGGEEPLLVISVEKNVFFFLTAVFCCSPGKAECEGPLTHKCWYYCPLPPLQGHSYGQGLSLDKEVRMSLILMFC